MRGHRALLILLAAGLVPAAAGATARRCRTRLVRVATFNASLNRAAAGALLRDLSTPDDVQARAVAEIIQRVRPDILLLQEFDYDAAGASLAAFQTNYLGRAQNGAGAASLYEYTFFTASNTGIPSGFDLDNDGRVGGGGDALGFGEFPGQYAMVLLSRFPIDASEGAHLPQIPVARSCRRPCCPTIRTRPPRPTGIQPTNSRCCHCRPRIIGMCRCASARRTLHLLDQPSHAARLRRARRSQRQAQSRRNPLLGRLPDVGR